MPDTPPEPILYAQASCPEGAKVRPWLIERRMAFTERDTRVDPEAASALAATGFLCPIKSLEVGV